MTEETLKRAKEIEKEVAQLSYINVILQGTENISKQMIGLNYTRKEVIDKRTITYDDLCIYIEDFFSKEELAEKVNHRIFELQKELDNL